MTSFELIIFDLDGVIYRGDEVLPYASEILNFLRKSNLKIRFLTNNSTKTRKFYCEKLLKMGIYAEENEIISSSYIAAVYLSKNVSFHSKIAVIGENGLLSELREILGNCNRFYNIVTLNGLESSKLKRPTRVDTPNSKLELPSPISKGAIPYDKMDFLIVGMDRNFNYQKLKYAHQFITAGAKFIATNKDSTFPAANGEILPGGGALISAIETSTKTKATVIGKPSSLSVKIILQDTKVSKDKTLLLGDRYETDIVAGKRAGVKTCLVLTGVTKMDEVEKLTSKQKPDYIIENLRKLKEIVLDVSVQ